MATPRSNFVKLRLTDLEKQDWQRAAGGARLLSEWIRKTCNAAADPSLLAPDEEIVAKGAEVLVAESKVPLSTVGAVIPNAKPVIVSDAIERTLHEHGIQDSGLAVQVRAEQAGGGERPEEISESSVSSPAPGPSSVVGLPPSSCPRWMHHRPGVYCGACKKVTPKGKR